MAYTTVPHFLELEIGTSFMDGKKIEKTQRKNKNLKKVKKNVQK